MGKETNSVTDSLPNYWSKRFGQRVPVFLHCAWGNRQVNTAFETHELLTDTADNNYKNSSTTEKISNNSLQKILMSPSSTSRNYTNIEMFRSDNVIHVIDPLKRRNEYVEPLQFRGLQGVNDDQTDGQVTGEPENDDVDNSVAGSTENDDVDRSVTGSPEYSEGNDDSVETQNDDKTEIVVTIPSFAPISTMKVPVMLKPKVPSIHSRPTHNTSDDVKVSLGCSRGFAFCHPSATGLLIIFIGLLFCYCYRCLRGSSDGVDRGRYRAVAAHYTANEFDDTFDDDLSYEELELANTYENGSQKRAVLDMKDLDLDEDNGGLTIREMNG